MKSTLIEYIQTYGKKSFHELPFSEVDALVLSQLSYLKMKGIVGGFHQKEFMSWNDIKKHPDFERLFTDPIYGSAHRKVFFLVSQSLRYRFIKTGFFEDWFDEKKELQFAAVTFLLGKTSIFISYRGTDDSLVGWKEDFNLSYLPKIPSQKHARDYLKGVARYREGHIILGGHSKGGNLAVYAASTVSENIQNRIRRVYSFDGVGFRQNFYDREGFKKISDRCCKIIPAQSLIGMLFSNQQNYRVVQSYRSGLAQHDLMFWKIRDGKFVYRKNLRRRNLHLARKINSWIDSLSLDQIAAFVNLLYELLKADGPEYAKKTGGSFLNIRLKSVCRKFKRLDKNKRKEFLLVIRKYFRI